MSKDLLLELLRAAQVLLSEVADLKTGLTALNQRMDNMATASDVAAVFADAKSAIATEVQALTAQVAAAITGLEASASDATALDAIVADIGVFKTSMLDSLTAIQTKAAAAIAVVPAAAAAAATPAAPSA
ncbi:hypothetical protein [Methylocella silvestris]|uniref:Uncharacterized protein n=1 Tax=Methylocella silvestris TaxID=199596 RepID=A0A2J7TJP4_METSI|nr:hypothetical protein [Methylocella silvestris]PNG26992.1 hypothetical protein CR492_04630 [Methylocella silvestris]